MALSKQNKELAELLMSMSNFETFWAYYSMSSGNLYKKEVKELAKIFLKNFDKIYKLYPDIIDNELIMEKMDTTVTDYTLLKQLKHWAKGTDLVPIDTFIKSKIFLLFFFFDKRWYLSTLLGISRQQKIIFSTEEFQHSERYLQWQPHLPESVMFWYAKDLDEKILSESQTIVVFGDIRRSQDLMTYTVNNEYYEQMMIRFFDTTRKLLNENLGIFDKFTGDGFLAYFNESICKIKNKNYIDCFLDFSKKYIEENYNLFEEWKQHVRKLPEKEIMVSLGADIGLVHFGNFSGHLVCIGDAIVWAERMCSNSLAGEISINNLLSIALKNRKDIKLFPVSGITKSGENFKASKIEFI
ncbi:MAG: hypothetical protein ACOWWR_17385 [Eubacteriales bacterium]